MEYKPFTITATLGDPEPVPVYIITEAGKKERMNDQLAAALAVSCDIDGESVTMTLAEMAKCAALTGGTNEIILDMQRTS